MMSERLRTSVRTDGGTTSPSSFWAAPADRQASPAVVARDAARQARARIPLVALVIDVIMMLAAVAAGGLLRGLLPLFPRSASPIPVGVEVVAGVIGLWVLVIYALGGYRVGIFGAGVDEFKAVAHSALATAGLVGIACYLAQYEFSRGLYTFSFLAGVPLLVLGRHALRTAVKSARRRGALLHRVVLAGLPSHIDEIAAVLRRESWLGYDVVGAITPPTDFREVDRLGDQGLGQHRRRRLGGRHPARRHRLRGRRRVQDVRADAPGRVGPRGARRPGRRRPERLRRVERARALPPGRRAPARAPRPAARAARLPAGQAHLRRRGLEPPDPGVPAGARVRRRPRLVARPRSDPLPADARGTGRHRVRVLQVPHDGHRRRGARRRPPARSWARRHSSSR